MMRLLYFVCGGHNVWRREREQGVMGTAEGGNNLLKVSIIGIFSDIC